jgi:Tfp pilus assembly protein PilP
MKKTKGGMRTIIAVIGIFFCFSFLAGAAVPEEKKHGSENSASAAAESAPNKDYRFNAQGKRDPFQPFIEALKAFIDEPEQTFTHPLQRYSLDQLKLNGIIVSYGLYTIKDGDTRRDVRGLVSAIEDVSHEYGKDPEALVTKKLLLWLQKLNEIPKHEAKAIGAALWGAYQLLTIEGDEGRVFIRGFMPALVKVHKDFGGEPKAKIGNELLGQLKKFNDIPADKETKYIDKFWNVYQTIFREQPPVVQMKEPTEVVALIQDPSNLGYTVTLGTPIGRGGGKVEWISSNQVIIAYVDKSTGQIAGRAEMTMANGKKQLQ